MSFFDSTPEGRPRPGLPDRLYAPSGPLWLNNPEQYFLPALLPWTTQLGRSDRAVVALSGIRVWPDCCTLDITIFSRRSLRDLPGGSPFWFGPPGSEPPGRGGFRFGVLLADGRRGTLHDQIPLLPPRPDVHPATDPAAEPVLRIGSGSGSQFHFESGIRLWPLPPDGPLTLVVDWLDQGIAETRTGLDGSAVRAAAAGATEIWPDLPPNPPGGGPRVGMRQASRHIGGFAGAAPMRARPVEPEPPSGTEHLGDEEGELQ